MNSQKITKSHLEKIYKPVAVQAHKGTQGHALLIGGSYGKMGSITLSAKAALHSGAGLVTAFIPKCGYEIIQTAVPEIMTLTDKQKPRIQNQIRTRTERDRYRPRNRQASRHTKSAT